MKYFNEFLHTLKLPSGKYPDRFEENIERPGLLSFFYIARYASSIIDQIFTWQTKIFARLMLRFCEVAI